MACEKVPKAKKLLKLQVDLGVETRQIVSGISLYYKPEDLIGHCVIVVTNLKPVKLCGVESKGMLLAASDGNDNLQVAFVDGMAPGSRVRYCCSIHTVISMTRLTMRTAGRSLLGRTRRASA